MTLLLELIMVNLPDSILSKLRPWQLAPARHLFTILSAGQNCIDLSSTGTGKTYVACAVSAMLGENALAVVPKIARSSWLRVADEMGAPLEVIGYEALRTGRTNFGRWEHQPPVPFKADEFFLCESCQCKVDFDDYRPCHCHANGTHCIKTKKHPWKYGNFIWAPEVKFLVADEVHRCSGLDSLNSDLLIAAKRQSIRVLGLSATAACTPLQMRALGYVLGLHGLNQNLPVRIPRAGEALTNPLRFCPTQVLPTFYQWAAKYDCRPDPVYRGLRWFAGAERQASIMADLHSKIIPERGVRVRTTDIPDFPERIITAELYDLEKDYEIERLYREMHEALASLCERETKDASSEHPLTKVLRARQRLELLVIPILTELTEDYLAKGMSVAIFVNFTATLTELRLRLKTDCVVDGSLEGTRYRDTAINTFQRNDNRLILLNNAAGGVAISLHDLHGGHPRVGLVVPGVSAVEFQQVCGRLHRAGGKSPAIYRIVLPNSPTGKKIKKSLDSKLTNLNSLNDGDFIPV